MRAADGASRRLILDGLHLDRARPLSVAAMHAEDWEELSRLARIHRLGPLLYERLAGTPVFDAMPQGVSEKLRAAHRKHALRNLAIYRELATVTRILDAADIPSIALKGAFLARFSYPEPGLRPMRDLDLLLRPDEAVKAFDLLKAHGYRPMFDGSPEAYFADRIHLPPLRRPGGVTIELHHRLTPPEMAGNGFEEALWARSIRRPLGGREVAFPCAEDMLLHLGIHATLDHQLDLGPLALVDVARLVETGQLDWAGFVQAVRSGAWQRAVLPLLYLAREHVGASIPREVMAALGAEDGPPAWLEAAEHLLFSDPAEHRLLDYDVQEILYSAKLSQRLSMLAGAVFPPRSVIARHFPVSAASPMAYLYYPRRWYRLFTGKLPVLLRSHVSREGALRQLAQQRRTLMKWLQAESSRGSEE